MRELSIVELDLIVGGYGEDTSGGFDESVYEPQATLMEDGSYSLAVTEADYSANVAAAEAEYWTIGIEGTITDGNGNVLVSIRVKSSNAS